jgi:hypothetical protein
MPSTSAKINYLLGLGERTEHDATLGKAFNTGNFKEVFLGLTAKSESIRQPIPLFTAYTPELANSLREKFKGKLTE